MNIYKQIEAFLFSDETPVAVTETKVDKFLDLKLKSESLENEPLKDGSIIRVTPDLSVGAKVEIINEDESLTPAYNADKPDLTLEDGTVISLDENSLITEIATPVAEAEVEEMATPEVETPKVDDNQKRFEEIEGKLEMLAQSILKMAEAFEGKKTEMKAVAKENAELKAKNTELSKKAAAPAANFKKFEKQETEIIDDKLARIIAIRESKTNK
jgi:hypothetical protein